jgi:hypothetical protein
MFEEILQFKDDIILCYIKQNIIKISGRVSPLLTWHISELIINSLSLLVTTSVLNQFSNH